MRSERNLIQQKLEYEARKSGRDSLVVAQFEFFRCRAIPKPALLESVTELGLHLVWWNDNVRQSHSDSIH